jgi:hypothetical protein
MDEKINTPEVIAQGTEIIGLAMRLIGTEDHNEIEGIRQTIKGLLYTARLIETLGPLAVQQAISLGMDEIEIEMIGIEVAEGR